MFFRHVLTIPIIALAVFASGCFKKPATEATAKTVDVPIVPVYNGVTDSYLVADGPCMGNTAIIFTYSSPLTPAKSIEATCSNDRVFINLPVNYGVSAQIFNISVVGRLQSKKATPAPATVNFYPLPKPLPGYAIVMVGPKNETPLSQYQQNALTTTFGIGGEAFSPQSQTDIPNDQLLRTGLSGVIDPSI
ncbi:MAG: hypothetical protein IPM57_03655 [Oligoflexia bacterium]|nr:hypothetical protein [Oligoflexia bacterium]